MAEINVGDWQQVVGILTTVSVQQAAVIKEVESLSRIIRGSDGMPGLTTKVDRLEQWAHPQGACKPVNDIEAILDGSDNNPGIKERVRILERTDALATERVKEWQTRLFYPLLMAVIVAIGIMLWSLVTHKPWP